MERFFGIHCDIARGAYFRREVFIEALDLCARNGITHFLPYLENMIRLPSIAKACPACAYTPEDWRVFDQHAAGIGVELVPHFNVIGHTERILPHYPELCGESGHREIDVTRPACRDWTVRCLKEFCAFSRSRYFLIGGDEWQAPDALLRAGRDIARIWADQINLAAEVLLQNGRTPIVWHDMMLHYPSTLKLVSQNVAVAFWFYDEDSDYPALSMFREAGFETLMAGGISGGSFSRRRMRATRCAIDATARHQAAGFFLTCWEYNRWETQKLALDLLGRMDRGETLPEPVMEVMSLFDSYEKLAADHPVIRGWTARMKAALEAPEWNAYPDTREYISAVLANDGARNLASYVRFHYPEGRFYDELNAPPPAPAVAPAPAAPVRPQSVTGFGVDVLEDKVAGQVLHFRHGGEQFRIYPKFGAVLDAWSVGHTFVIGDHMSGFLKRNLPLPGGYRSYTAACGLRPIWALGCHENPNILWQFPFAWKLVENGPDRIVLELSRHFEHADIRHRVTVLRKQAGFVYEPGATNLLPGMIAGFNFNLALAFEPADVAACTLAWQENGQTRTREVATAGDSFFAIPAHAGITVRTRSYEFTIASPPEQTAGFYVDWSGSYITPDLHAVYRPVAVGETLTTRWQLQAVTRRGC